MSNQLTMQERMLDFFSPCVTLRWRGLKGKLTRHWFPDKTKDEQLLRQFMNEAGLPKDNKATTDQLDAITDAAGKHGYCVETIGEPD